MDKVTRHLARRLRTRFAAVLLVIAVATPVTISAVTDQASAARACPATPAATVKDVQSRLESAGFWVNGADGIFGPLTSNGVSAFQKYKGLPRTGCIDAAVVRSLSLQTTRAVPPSTTRGNRYPDRAHIDETKQLLYIVRDDRVVWVFNTSTGNEKRWKTETSSGTSITPNGAWRIFRQRDGWRVSKLGVGNLYRPKYFKGGNAIHGSALEIPPYPASHGCVRVTITAMDLMWEQDLLPMDSVVVVSGDPSP